jgi:hypothetical protein
MSHLVETQLFKTLSAGRKPQILYHYTSGSGLIGILQSKSIWATSIRFLNDSTEYTFALDLADKVIKERIEKATNTFDRALNKVLEEKLTASAQGEIYVTSFTENGDQLSQWRAYCPPAGGYALGFSSKALIKFKEANPDCFLARCVYELKSQEELVRNLVQQIARFAEESLSAKVDRDRVFRESFKLLGRLLQLVAPALKDSSFAEEQEWRLIRQPISFEHEPHFRAGRSVLIPYQEHSFPGKDHSVPIEELVIGPTPHPDLARDGAQALLSSCGLNSTTVRSSAIPYRTW